MIRPVALLVLLCALPMTAASAQVFSEEPLCVNLANMTGDEVLGHIETDEYYDESGKLSWHRSNFRLQADETRQVCSTGPFFDGYTLRIVLKTIVPLYSCLTEMNRDVAIRTFTDAQGTRTLSADCPSEKLGR